MSPYTPGKAWVDSAPPLEPYQYGLFSVATFEDGEGPWERRGVEYFTDHCAQGGYVLGMCPAPAPGGGTTHDKTVLGGPELAQGTGPFTVYCRAECNAVGFEEPRAMALTRLGIIEEREVEKAASALLLGAPDPRYPMGDATSPATTPRRAVGVLEQDAALNYGGAPTFHAPRWAQPELEGAGLLQPVHDTGTVMRTRLGSRIAFGGGYADNPFDPATPPPADTFWLIATGTVRGSRAPAFANETFTPENNLRMAMAERTYALDADCYRAAVLVTVGSEA